MNSKSFTALIIILYFLSITVLKKRHTRFDTTASSSLKGILSILIILSHINFHADLPIFLTITAWGGTKVALFFFISGYGLMASYLQKGASYLDGFLFKRLWKVVKPLFIVTISFLLLYYLDTGTFKGDLLNELITKGMTPLPYSWFAYAIIVFYLFFFLAFKSGSNDMLKIFITFGLTLLVTLVMKEVGYDRAWWVSNLAFPLGLFFRYKEKVIISYSRTRFGNLALVPLLCFLVLALVLLKIEILYAFAYVLIVMMIMILMSYVKLPSGPIFSTLGKVSYETYLIHGAVLTLLRGKHVYIMNGYLYLATAIILTLILSIITHSFFSGVNRKQS
ncbi:acyltransferase family protein [Sphingobacterium oryzagri]|uniref:Acyltransferase family protein n=1 Tax=Sphingobacterium oryzagri TaxID=3025669 RepID=A0ABY7WFE8_9SPHI|nr:acyltransferase family protein [Sphingobacterium sp. KACC 22765]WDF68346.1 acyltransferase family protein [Sphingobacterium sp. KACC 22765]